MMKDGVAVSVTIAAKYGSQFSILGIRKIDVAGEPDSLDTFTTSKAPLTLNIQTFTKNQSHVASPHDIRFFIRRLRYKHLALANSRTSSVCTICCCVLLKTADGTHPCLSVQRSSSVARPHPQASRRSNRDEFSVWIVDI